MDCHHHVQTILLHLRATHLEQKDENFLYFTFKLSCFCINGESGFADTSIT